MSSVSEESVLDLIKNLIQNNIGENTSTISLNRQRPKPSYKKLKSDILAILFENEHNEIISSHNSPLSVFEELTWITYVLSQKHEYDKTHHLSKCIEKLTFTGELQEIDNLTSILKVLIGLSNISPNKSVPLFQPWIIAKQNEKWILPNGPLNYGDTRLHTSSSNWYYVHYPPQLFDDIHLNENRRGSYIKNFSRSDLEPGSNTKRQPSIKRCLGALLNPMCNPNPDTVLAIPELPNRKGLELTTIFRSCLPSSAGLCYEQETDEGYASSQCSANGDLSEITEFYLVSVQKGETCIQSENKFVTESSPEIVEKIWRLNNYHWNILSDQPSAPIWNEICQNKLCKDILHLIIGVESDSFVWNKEKNSFKLKEGICCKGITPGAIKSHVEEFIICGNQINKLEHICYDDPNRNDGLVWSALIRSVKSFLAIFREKTFSYDGGLLPMKTVFSGLLSKLYFLGRICGQILENFSGKPFGLQIINILLQNMRIAQNHSHSYLVLSILKTCCQPFFQFLERWIYCGENYDPFGEFFIYSDRAALLFKDNRYWRDGHSLVISHVDNCEPLIKSLVEEAFKCGKTVSFLSACSVNHSLISEGKSHPEISFGWTSQHVDKALLECQQFATNVRQTSVSVNEMLLEEYDELCKEREISLINASTEQKINTINRVKSFIKLKKEKDIKEKNLKMADRIKDIEDAKENKRKQTLEDQNEDEKIRAIHNDIENTRKYNAERVREKLINDYEEFSTKSNKRELLLKEKLKITEQNLNLIDNNVNGVIQRSEIDSINSNSETEYTNYESEVFCATNAVIAESPLEELSKMSITSDDSVDRTSEIIVNQKDYNYKTFAENKRNTMKSNIFDATPNEITYPKLVPDRISEYIYQNTLNLNEIRTNYLTNNQDINRNVSSHTVVSRSPTIQREFNQDTDVRDDMSVVTDSADSYVSSEDFQMSTATSMDGLRLAVFEKQPTISRMKKSKSDTFFSRGRKIPVEKSNRPKSCMYGKPNCSDLPELRDQDKSSWVPIKLPLERFSDTDLLEARNLDTITKLSEYNRNYDYKLSDQPAQMNLLVKARDDSSTKELLHDESISTAVNYVTKTISLHVIAQTKLANEALTNYLLIDQSLLRDLKILQSVMLAQDASICRSLVPIMINKLTPCCNVSSVLTPKELNCALSESLSASTLEQQLMSKFFFVVTKVPIAFQSPYDVWDCVELQYKVQWPNSVIIHSQVMKNYTRIWKFLMKIHHSVYVMDELYRMYLRGNRLRSSTNDHQVNQISVMCYEINNFMKIVLSYVSHQGIQTSLASFEKGLRQKTLTVDDLIEEHSEFLNIIMAKCFLTQKGSLVYNILTDIFVHLHKFSTLINTIREGLLIANVFEEAKKLFRDFKKLAMFMTKLLQKVSVHTRVEHVEAFDLKLNFNPNYEIK